MGFFKKKSEKEQVKTVEEKKVEVVKAKEVVKPAPRKEETVEEEKTTRILLGKYEVFPAGGSFLYRLKASNGAIMVVSELYTTARGAEDAVETVKKNCETGDIQIRKDKHGLWQFKVFAANKRLIVSSANYKTAARCESAAESFKRFASISPVVTLDEDPDQLMQLVDTSKIEEKDSGKIEFEQTDEGYVFNLYANNGQLLCTSIAYTTKSAAKDAVDTVKEGLKKGKIYVTCDKNEVCQFKLYSEAGRALVSGEAYKSKAFAVNAAESFASFLNLAEIEK